MLISHSHKFIYFHLWKTGGTSIKFALKEYKDYGLSNKVDSKGGEFLSDDFSKHITAKELKKQLPIQIWNEYFKFTFVRNPWDLQISLYHYIIQTPLHHEYEIVHKLNFEEFLNWRLSNNLITQSDFVMDDSGNQLLDFIGKFETLENDFYSVCQKIKLKVNLPHLNKSEHALYPKYYNNETMNLIQRKFKNDVKLFKYKFKPAPNKSVYANLG